MYICSLLKTLKLVHTKLDLFQITNIIHTINSRLKVHWQFVNTTSINNISFHYVVVIRSSLVTQIMHTHMSRDYITHTHYTCVHTPTSMYTSMRTKKVVLISTCTWSPTE